MPTRLDIASSDIFQSLREGPVVLSRSEIDKLLSENRGFWRLAQSTTVAKFIDFLKEKGQLQEHRFELPHRPTTRFTWGDVSTLSIVQSLRPKGYFTHYTAMQLHGLTQQIPKTIYLNFEQRMTGGGGILTQEGLDRAFKGKCRVSNNKTEFRDQTVCLLNGQNTGELGVIGFEDDDEAALRVSSFERTLIDITVRPIYSGGVFQVAEAFAAAHEHVSINRLVAFLRKLNYTYPYHQAIGFYLERCGKYSAAQTELLRQFDMHFDFYLTHAVKETDYIPEWKLFIPKGF